MRRSRAPAAVRRRLPQLPEPVTIERLSHDGRGIAHWQGKTLFVAGALTGERVRVRATSAQRRYLEAETLERLNDSPERQRPPCEHFGQCGGCQLQHLNPAAQLAHKEHTLLDQLERWAGLAPAQRAPVITSASEGYRHRARLAVHVDRQGRVSLGFRRARSRSLVPVNDCPVLAPALRALLDPLRDWLSGLARPRAIGHVELLLADEGPALVVRQSGSLEPHERLALARSLPAQVAGRLWWQTRRAGALETSEGARCDPRLSYRLPAFDLTLGFHPADFTQVNPEVNRRMVAQALEWLAPETNEAVLDLFCGMGNFTLPLARSGARVRGLEGADAMVARGAENARRNGLSADFARADLTDPASLAGEHPGAVLLDPPRDGARALMAPLVELGPQRLVYISCNPATLARDAAELAAGGYRLQKLGVLDMFPHTEHLESMALFRRR